MTISIVTATFNATSDLPRLIESLRRQTDKDFEWVVADGVSTDGTLELLRSARDLDIVISSQPDFGIYDALNRAIEQAKGEYYVVAGADDCFEADAVERFRRAIEASGADIVAAEATFAGRRLRVKKGPSWLFGQSAYIAVHSLASAFRKDLHIRFGKYSKKYPIAADHLFVIRACEGGATHSAPGFVAGSLGHNGVSAVDWVGSATELFRVQLAMGRSFAGQLVMLTLRLCRGLLK